MARLVSVEVVLVCSYFGAACKRGGLINGFERYACLGHLRCAVCGLSGEAGQVCPYEFIDGILDNSSTAYSKKMTIFFKQYPALRGYARALRTVGEVY